MSAYDRWLEEPYTRAAAEEAAFEQWCEANAVAFDAPDAWQRFEDACAEAQPDPDFEDEREASYDAEEDRRVEVELDR